MANSENMTIHNAAGPIGVDANGNRKVSAAQVALGRILDKENLHKKPSVVDASTQTDQAQPDANGKVHYGTFTHSGCGHAAIDVHGTAQVKDVVDKKENVPFKNDKHRQEVHHLNSINQEGYDEERFADLD